MHYVKNMKKIYKNIMDFADDISKNHISAYSAQTSYFIIMSVFPFVLILLSMIRYTSLTEENLLNLIFKIVPEAFFPIIKSIVEEIYERATAFISISVIIAIWSSAKCIHSITNGFNLIYNVKETRNFVFLRLRSAFYTVIFVMAIIASLVLNVFGEWLDDFFARHTPVIAAAFHHILDWKLVIMLAFQIIIFALMYKFLPNRKSKFIRQLPGAVFSSVVWNIFSYLFSIYIGFGRLSYTYGSLTTLVVVMLWLYFCINIIFIGAQINSFFEPQIWWFQKKTKERKNKKKRKKKGVE